MLVLSANPYRGDTFVIFYQGEELRITVARRPRGGQQVQLRFDGPERFRVWREKREAEKGA